MTGSPSPQDQLRSHRLLAGGSTSVAPVRREMSHNSGKIAFVVPVPRDWDILIAWRMAEVWRALVREHCGAVVMGAQCAAMRLDWRKRFFLAETAPACNRRLRGLFGYNAATVTAERILNGTYKYPDDFDRATREICEESASVRLKVPRDSINLTINSKDWKMQWRGRRETTSSS